MLWEEERASVGFWGQFVNMAWWIDAPLCYQIIVECGGEMLDCKYCRFWRFLSIYWYGCRHFVVNFLI